MRFDAETRRRGERRGENTERKHGEKSKGKRSAEEAERRDGGAKITGTVEADYGDRGAGSGYVCGTARRRARDLADRVAATGARGGAVQRGRAAGGGAVRTGAGTGERDRVAGQRAVVCGGVQCAAAGQSIRLPGVSDLRARSRSQRMFHRIARLCGAVDCGCHGAQLTGWVERGDGAPGGAGGAKGGGAAGGGAAQTAGRDRAGRDSAGFGWVADGGTGVGGAGGRIDPGGRRVGAGDGAAPGFAVDHVSDGDRGGVAVLPGISRGARRVEAARGASGVCMGGGRRGGGRGDSTGSRGAVPIGGGGAEGLQVAPGEAGGEFGEVALDDGLEFGGSGEGAYVQEDFVDGSGRGVERAFDYRVGVGSGEGGFQIAGVALRED